MTLIRRGRSAIAVLAAGLAVATAGCGSSSSGSTGSDAVDSVDLGAKKEATGAPVKVGFIGDAEAGASAFGNAIAAAEATAKYANDYQGGLGGHKIELVTCSTEQKPSEATACAIKLAKENVVAVVMGSIGQDHSVNAALKGTGIPLVVSLTADVDIMGNPDAFVFQNPLAIGTASIQLLKDAQVDKAGILVLDLPSATGPVEQLSKPLYEGANIKLDLIPISLQIADPTAQVQEAISSGNQGFSIFGDVPFVAKTVKSLKQLGFNGPMITNVATLTEDQIASIPGGVEGLTTLSTVTRDPESDALAVYAKIMKEYGDDVDTNSDNGQLAYQTLAAFIKAVSLTPGAGTTAKSVEDAMKNMPTGIPLPLAPGLVINCNGKAVPVLPSVCNGRTLATTLKSDGTAKSEKTL